MASTIENNLESKQPLYKDKVYAPSVTFVERVNCSHIFVYNYQR